MFAVPKDYRKNLQFRRHVLQRAKNNPILQRALWHACRRDIRFFVDVFVWQINPNLDLEGEEVGPFILWGWQEGVLQTLIDRVNGTDRGDLVIEKSREMGATWLCLIVLLWFILFHKNKTFLLLSRNAESVDRSEDGNSLFEKLDFVLSHLPPWIKGRPDQLRRKKMRLRHRTNNSTITGQATTAKAGVSGRANAIFVDEFSQIDQDYQIKGRTADTSRCRIYNFTHVGIGTAAYELSVDPNVRKLVIHWSMHPQKNKGLYRYDAEKDEIEIIDKEYDFPPDYPFVRDGSPAGPFALLRSPWYDEEVKRRNSKRDVAMDLDIDPRGSTYQFFDPNLIQTLKTTYCVEPYWEGTIDFVYETGEFRGLVPIVGGPLKFWFHPDTAGRPPQSVYGMGGDIAAGTGATPTCFSIVDFGTGEKVAAYADARIDPLTAGSFAVALCWYFASDSGEGARFAWEMQGPGVQFGQRVLALGYRNVYFRTGELGLNKTVSDTPGWVPNPISKRSLLTEYRAALAQRRFINRDWRTLDETLSFSYNDQGWVEHGSVKSGDDPSRSRENHADRPIADALANKMQEGRGPVIIADRKIVDPDNPPVNSVAWRRKYRMAMQDQELYDWRT